MKLRVLFLVFITPYLFSLNITLKEKIFITESIVYLKDIVKENIDTPIDTIYFKIEKTPFFINSDTILKELNKNGIFDVNIIGSGTIVTILKKEEIIEEGSNKKNAIKFLEDYLSQYVDSKFKISIDVKKVEPDIDIFNLEKDFNWEIEKFEKGLKDILNLKKVFLIIDNKKYTVNLNVHIYTNIYISKRHFLKNDILKADSFTIKYVDISTYIEPDNIIFDIEKAENLKFVNSIGAGEVLRWKDLIKMPLVVKDENCKAILKKKNFEITLLVTALTDGYENQKIKIKIKNGKELVGTLRNNNGEIYVEL
ncbi:MAG TPA: flagellar basal body P-ring formation chaperone FlgA [Spirochaetota bacterium]|nr:flagellar basal body P-ring formation chaperone FlgA [Spirochaetota bacterium]HOL56340.1 flagellar basal body P-ring formation chaperone FlgA [Spirochaetota bacterium]HPP03543.1 flagellar basal body P-ring formation chaperone FlgA [Spirochaetota bacterium]